MSTTKPEPRRAPPRKKQLEKLANFRYQLRRFLRFSEQVSRQHGVTPLQYQLMLQIEGFPGRNWATVGELAERLQAQHHAVVALVTRCEAHGLVVRRTSMTDRRQVHVTLTRAGSRRLAQLSDLHWAQLRALQRGPSVGELFAEPGSRPGRAR